jgi:hypothetical protein
LLLLQQHQQEEDEFNSLHSINPQTDLLLQQQEKREKATVHTSLPVASSALTAEWGE